MQAVAHKGSQALSRPHSATRRALQAPAFTGVPANGRALSVQVFAKGKGKGKQMFRGASGVPGQMEMLRREPPTPEVDPENAEFVIFVRTKKYMDPLMGKVTSTPSPWIPLSIVKSGQAANFLVKALEVEWGRKLYGQTLVRNIATSVYKDRLEIEKSVRKNYPPFANSGSKDFEYAFKIRDKSQPKEWNKAEGVTVFPPEEELGATGLDQLKTFFSMDNIMSMFKSPDAAPSASSSSSPSTTQQ